MKSTNSANKKILVIVESPSKCEKIQSYLNSQGQYAGLYKCIASMGHLTEIKNLKDINCNDFDDIKYSIIPEKERQFKTLQKEIAKSIEVILATDDDREGEAIAWHICRLYNLSIEHTKRIIFHEITQSAILQAINNPTYINMNIVNSQRCRQIIDMLVGFYISPMLWKYLPNKKGLSAGRCQTPALRLIQDNLTAEKEQTCEYNTIGYFKFAIPYNCRIIMTNKEDVIEFMHSSLIYKYFVENENPRKINKSPPEPLTTSRIQQLSGLSPKDTMSVCQKLYEAGYITYMRTDCKQYSREFINNCASFITTNYGDNYANMTLIPITDKSAHEAIRPTNIALVNISRDNAMGRKEQLLYKLIWEITIQSCMMPSVYFTFKSYINAVGQSKEDLHHLYSRICEKIDFYGWEIISANSRDKYAEMEILYNRILSLNPNTEYKMRNITSKIAVSGGISHFSESRLINTLEKIGIGRPSTFSSIVEKIKDKEYVRVQDVQGTEIKCYDYELDFETANVVENITMRTFGNEKNKLVLQTLGNIVCEFLINNFTHLFNYDYTREMEDKLDAITSGAIDYRDICRECYELLNAECSAISVKKFGISIDENNTLIVGKNGLVIKCNENGENTFKAVNADISIDDINMGVIGIEKVANKNIINLGRYESSDLILKCGKFGIYVAYAGKNKSLAKYIGNRPIENITREEVIEIIENEEQDDSIVRVINTEVKIMRGKNGKSDYILFKTKKMKKPKFIPLGRFDGDYKSCSGNEIIEFIGSY